MEKLRRFAHSFIDKEELSESKEDGNLNQKPERIEEELRKQGVEDISASELLSNNRDVRYGSYAVLMSHLAKEAKEEGGFIKIEIPTELRTVVGSESILITPLGSRQWDEEATVYLGNKNRSSP